MDVSYNLLLSDLYMAYNKAKKGKSKKHYIANYTDNLDENLNNLCNDLLNKTYKPGLSYCFYINAPKPREIFAALFEDRIVLHLYYEYTHVLFERTFIYDSYSCIKGKGTHFGVKRLNEAIKKITKNYTNNAYCLKCDISGYFMNIDRNILYETICNSLKKMRFHKIDNIYWNDKFDFDLIYYLTKEIALLDPTENCILTGNLNNRKDLPKRRSLFKQPKGKGLPIGNLTSQLFSNIYLNLLDLFIKNELHIKYYGRYVDDFYILSTDRNLLKNIIPKIEAFLTETLGLKLQKGKTRIIPVYQGIEFLGAFIKLNRIYISNISLKRIIYKVNHLNPSKVNVISSINSFLGSLIHYKTFNIRYKLFFNKSILFKYGYFNNSLSKFIQNKQLCLHTFKNN